MMVMKNQNSTKFGVDLEGLNIPDEIKMKIAGEIEAVVLRNIAETDLVKNGKYVGTHIRYPYWWGLIACYLDSFANIPDIKVKEDIEMMAGG
jgi:hypothetical protein